MALSTNDRHSGGSRIAPKRFEYGEAGLVIAIEDEVKTHNTTFGLSDLVRSIASAARAFDHAPTLRAHRNADDRAHLWSRRRQAQWPFCGPLCKVGDRPL